MVQFPLIYAFNDKVVGNGYMAAIEVHGTILACEEEGGWWIYGVMPGGVAGSGETLNEAYDDFRKGFHSVLVDHATECPEFHDFRKAAKGFFYERNEPRAAEWTAARELVRAGKVELKLKIRLERTDPLPRIEVSHQAITPQANLVAGAVEEEVGVAA